MERASLHTAAIAVAGLLTASSAQAQAVSSVLEQYGVLGTFAIDCAKPVSPANYYTVFRSIDPNSAQIDLMVGPTQRQYSYVIDRASGGGPTMLTTSMANAQQRLNLTYRVEGQRLRTMESAREGGPVIIKGGRFVESNAETAWLNKCS